MPGYSAQGLTDHEIEHLAFPPEVLWAAARGLGLSSGDHTIALERSEVLADGIIFNAEPFRQIFDGKALLILEKQGE